MGLCTLSFVYGAMLLGQALFIFAVCWPIFTGHQTNGAIVFSMVVELLIFEYFWFMMLWCHTHTMCKQPGFIPHNYQYKKEKVPTQYLQFFNLFESFKVSTTRSSSVQGSRSSGALIKIDEDRF